MWLGFQSHKRDQFFKHAQPGISRWFSSLSLNAMGKEGAHCARNSTAKSREPRGSLASSWRLKGWRRRTSSPETGFLRPGQGSAGGPPWHAPHSRPSSLQLLWRPEKEEQKQLDLWAGMDSGAWHSRASSLCPPPCSTIVCDCVARHTLCHLQGRKPMI